MGFFIKDAPPPKARISNKPPPVMEGATGCDACSLKKQWPLLLSSRMKMTTVPGADILVLGEAPGCIHGDSLIEVAYRDKSVHPKGVPIRDLINQRNFPVYSFDIEQQKLVIGLVYKVWYSGRKPVYRVTYEWKFAKDKTTVYLQDSIIVTKNHPFLLKRYAPHDPFNGIKETSDYISIEQGLRSGHSLQPFYRRTEQFGYHQVGIKAKDMLREGRFLLGHIIGRPLVSGEDCHHMDDNKENDSPANLELLTTAEHARLHTSSKNPMDNPEFRERHKEAMQKPEYHKLMRELQLKSLADPEVYRKRVEQVKEAGKETRFPVNSYWADNHKVISVEYIGEDDVYDMQIERYHNFAVNGIFVHNSEEDKEGKQFVGDSGKLLNELIPASQKKRLAWQNAVRCRPPNNATPTPSELHACSIHLEQDILAIRPKAILGVGSVPLGRFFQGTPIGRIHGQKFPVTVGGFTTWYFPVIHPSFVLRTGGKYSPGIGVLKSDIRNFFDYVDRWPDASKVIRTFSENDVIIVNDFATAIKLLERMSDPIALDFETQGLRYYEKGSILLTAGVSDDKTTIAFSIDHPEKVNPWARAVLRYIVEKRQWIAHFASMELPWLHSIIGMDWLPENFHDTAVLFRMRAQRAANLGLDDLTRIYFGFDVKSASPKFNKKNMVQYPLSQILPYNGLDAQAAAAMYRTLEAEMPFNRQSRQYQRNVTRAYNSIRSTSAMELVGLDIDLNKSEELSIKFNNKLKEIVKYAHTLYEVREFERQKQRPFNIASSVDVGEALVEYGKCFLPKTKGGKQYSTDDSNIAPLLQNNPLAKAVQDYREYSNANSTWIEPIYSRRLLGVDGRIHPKYKVLQVETGRLSSEEPNAQNFAKHAHGEVRAQIVAPEGYIFLAGDFAQLEARILAMASQDRKFCEAIITGFNIHSYWRDYIIKVYPAFLDHITAVHGAKTIMTDEKILELARQETKGNLVFAAMYGATMSSCADRMAIPENYMKQIFNAFWETYPGVQAWLNSQRNIYRNTGTIQTLTGLCRHAILDGNETINNPIQGTGAHIVLEAQNALHEMSIRRGDKHLLPRINIHDDLVFVVPEDETAIEQYAELIGNEMVKPRFDFITVPLSTEIRIGKDWASLVPICEITGTYNRS